MERREKRWNVSTNPGSDGDGLALAWGDDDDDDDECKLVGPQGCGRPLQEERDVFTSIAWGDDDDDECKLVGPQGCGRPLQEERDVFTSIAWGAYDDRVRWVPHIVLANGRIRY